MTNNALIFASEDLGSILVWQYSWNMDKYIKVTVAKRIFTGLHEF